MALFVGWVRAEFVNSIAGAGGCGLNTICTWVFTCCEMSDAIHDIKHMAQTIILFSFEFPSLGIITPLFTCIYKYPHIEPTNFSVSY